MNTKKRDAAATRERILDAAQQLFISQGYGSTSISQVANLCGVGKSLVMHHFGTKENLWAAVKARRFESFKLQQQALFADSDVSLEQLMDSVRAYFYMLKREPDLVQLLVRAELEQDLECSRYDHDLLGTFISRIEAAQNLGIIRADINPAHLLILLINSVTQWFEVQSQIMSWPTLADDPDLDDHYLETFLGIVRRGIEVTEE